MSFFRKNELGTLKYEVCSSLTFSATLWIVAIIFGYVDFTWGLILGWALIALVRMEAMVFFENWLETGHQSLPDYFFWSCLTGLVDACLFTGLCGGLYILVNKLGLNSPIEASIIFVLALLALGVPWSLLVWTRLRPNRAIKTLDH